MQACLQHPFCLATVGCPKRLLVFFSFELGLKESGLTVDEFLNNPGAAFNKIIEQSPLSEYATISISLFSKSKTLT